MTWVTMLEITPEPSREEREAIEAAIAVVLNGTRPPRSAWWHAGLVDAAEDDEDRS